MLVPLGKEKIVLYSEIVGMLVDVVINILLIPKLASSGAAIGTLVAEISVFIVQYFALRNTIKNAFRKVNYIAIIISILVSSILASMVRNLQFGLFMTLCLSAMIFFGTYIFILTIVKEPLIIEIENQLLNKILKKRKKGE